MFKTTARRKLEAIEVSAAARQFKVGVRQAIEALLAAELREGETMPDLDFFQELIGRRLDSSSSAMSEIDSRCTSQLVSLAALRVRRDELAGKLRERFRDVRYLLSRAALDGIFKAALPLREGRISKVKPLSLLQGARDLVVILRDPELAIGAADPAWASAAAGFAAALEAEAGQLELVLAELSPQQKAKEGNLGAKVADLRAAVETNRRCAELLFGLYRVAGLDFHAERLRPRGKRKRNVKTEPAPAGPDR